MKITNLKQRTKEWFLHRKKYINATEIASIMDLNPFQNQNQLIRNKLFGSDFSGNKYIDHGIKFEPIAKTYFENKINYKFKDEIFIDDTKTFSSSLDGYNEELNVLLEIKCPFAISKTWTNFFKNNEIPISYYCQIQCQLHCSKSKFGYFLVYLSDNPTNSKITRVYLDKEFIQKMIIATSKFQIKLNQIKEELLQTKFLKTISII